jgi:Pyruvate phosphate dikinase, AMP/ATP-binding domain
VGVGEGVQARPVVALADRAALDPAVAGAKTAAWARAISAGLPTLAGFVITTGSREITQLDAALAAWRSLTPDEAPVVVSSSSPVEDGAGSSMAGAFTSVLDVRSERAFLTAVQQVLESARIGGIRAPMAVLVQPFVAAEWGGVLFTADPITGRAEGAASATRAGVALRTLHEARDEGVEHDDLVQRAPVVLALVPPRIGGRPQLPDPGAVSTASIDTGHPMALAREARRRGRGGHSS